MVGSIDPRCETVRGTHWPKKVAWLFGARVAETILASGPKSPHQQAGHMDASDPIRPSKKLLWHGGRPHMGEDFWGGMAGYDCWLPGTDGVICLISGCSLPPFAASLIITRGVVGVAGVTELPRRVELRQRSSLVLAAVAAEVLSCRSSSLKCQIDLKTGGSDDSPFLFSSVGGERFSDRAGSLGAGGILRYRQL